jgi:hypothetical protein
LECFWHIWFVSNLQNKKYLETSTPFSRNTLIPYFEKSSGSLKTIFWKKIYSTNSKIVMTIFQTQGFLWSWDFLLGYPKTMKFRDLLGSLTWKKFFMNVFEFIGQFFFQNDVFKLKEVFSE